MYFKIIFLLLLAVNPKVKTNEICVKNDKNTCDSDLKYDCHLKYCSSNKQVCDLFKKLSSSKVFKYSIMRHKKLEDYQKILRNISHCKEETLYWDKTQICMNIKKCISKKKIPLRIGNSYFIKEIDCKCRSIELEYKCESNFCTSDKYVCDEFKKAVKNNFDLKFIHECNNI